jgi:hypothetical protein
MPLLTGEWTFVFQQVLLGRPHKPSKIQKFLLA